MGGVLAMGHIEVLFTATAELDDQGCSQEYLYCL